MHFDFSLQHIYDASGLTLSIIGMAIVFASLAIISLFIGGLPRFLERLDRWTSKQPKTSAAKAKSAKESPQKEDKESEILAVIAAVLEHEMRRPDGSDPLRLTLNRAESGSFWGRAGRMRTFSSQELSQR